MNASIRTDGADVLLVLPKRVDVIYLDWSHFDAFCQSLKRAWRAAKQNEAAGIAGNEVVEAERRAIRIGRRGRERQVALIFDRRLDRLRLPWRAAQQMWQALLAKVREGDALQHWRRTVADQQLLIQHGIPLGITPPVIRPALREAMAGGIAPTSVVGTPTLIGR